MRSWHDLGFGITRHGRGIEFKVLKYRSSGQGSGFRVQGLGFRGLGFSQWDVVGCGFQGIAKAR